MKRLALLIWLCCSPVWADITTGLIGQWDCQDNAASSTVVATVGVNGTYNSAPSTPANTSTASVSGPGGSYPLALQFDGSDDYVNSLNNTTTTDYPVTLAWWSKPDAFGQIQTAASWCDNATLTKYLGSYIHTNQSFAIQRRNTTPINTLSSASNSTAGVWAHFCLVFNSDSSVSVYKDGAFVETLTGLTSVAISADSFNDLQIGRVRNNTLQNYDGAICGVRVYARALSAGDVAELDALADAVAVPIFSNSYSRRRR